MKQRQSDQEILDGIRFLVGDTFSTTVDGSEERANYLADLALARAKDALKEQNVGWLKSRRLLKSLQEDIERERQQVLF